MTVVISFFQRGNPILVGDLLLSGNETKVPVWLPTTGSINNVFPQGSGFVPVGLAQKIAIISDRFVVAWSGRWIEARGVIADIRQACKSWSWQPDAVQSNIVNIIEGNRAGDLSLIWLLYDGSQVIQNGFNTFQLIGKQGYGRILGVGSESALDDFYRLMDIVSSSDAAENAGHPALTSALATACAFSLRELLDPNILVNYFGGGYEVLVLAEHCFQKLDDYVFVIWDAEETTEGYKVSAPYYFQRHLYCGDVLLIRAAKLESAGENEAKYAPRTFLVHPASRQINAQEANTLPNVDLSASLVCNIVRIKRKNGRVEMLVRASRWVNQPRQMIVTETNGKIEVAFRSDYVGDFFRNSA